MQQDHACRITLLNAYIKANVCRVGRLTQCGDHGNALSRVQSEWLVLGYRVHDSEFCVMRAAEKQCGIESGSRRLREVDSG
jgi:hypothetical protein